MVRELVVQQEGDWDESGQNWDREDDLLFEFVFGEIPLPDQWRENLRDRSGLRWLYEDQLRYTTDHCTLKGCHGQCVVRPAVYMSAEERTRHARGPAEYRAWLSRVESAKRGWDAYGMSVDVHDARTPRERLEAYFAEQEQS